MIFTSTTSSGRPLLFDASYIQLYPIKNSRSPVQTESRINIFKLYALPILKYAGAAWTPYIRSYQWSKVEAIQTIGLCAVIGTPKYVWNTNLQNSATCSTIEESIFNQLRALIPSSTHQGWGAPSH